MAKTVDTSRKILLTGKLKHYIDLNTDFGQTQDKEFFAREDYRLLNYVSSVNIPCCVHDGNPKEIKEFIDIARSYHCAVGSHIAFPDPVNYGYSLLDLDNDELAAWIQVQMGAFQALVKSRSLEIEHVRPHGALYGLFLNDFERAKVVAETLFDFNKWTILVAPAGPILDRVSEETGISTAPEIYLGKRYSAEGLLLKENFHENLNPQGVLDQAKQLINDSSLTSIDGKTVDMKFRTLHLSPRLDGVTNTADELYKLIGQPVSLPVAAVGASGWL